MKLKNKAKKVIFTYEGYPWEKMLNYKIKKFDSSIKTYGYFFQLSQSIIIALLLN